MSCHDHSVHEILTHAKTPKTLDTVYPGLIEVRCLAVVNNAKGPSIFVQSPCVNVCELNDQDLCVGCLRTLDEIGRWSGADAHERLVILDAIAKRTNNDREPAS